VMTGSTVIDDAKRKKVLALGAARFMDKPFSVEELIEEIEMVVWEGGRP
jgi:DNA-binding response OmpR family regulator